MGAPKWRFFCSRARDAPCSRGWRYDGEEDRLKLEICVENPAGIAAARDGGADRIELCSALAVGGLTPSEGLIATAVELCAGTGVSIHAMVRPRAGDFAYDEAELALAIREAESLLAAGADGLVFGAARDGRLDSDALRMWTGRFGGRPTRAGSRVELSLHRAIDVVEDPVSAVQVAVDLGFDRILSSGGARTAMEGRDALRRMVESAGGHCRIAAGSGITPENVRQIIDATGVDEVHASAGRDGTPANAKLIELGFAAGPSRFTEIASVRSLKDGTIK